jgi:hypothetical protein
MEPLEIKFGLYPYFFNGVSSHLLGGESDNSYLEG